MKNIFYGNAKEKLDEAFLYLKSQIHFKSFNYKIVLVKKLAHIASRIGIFVCCFAFWLFAGSVRCIAMRLYLAPIQRRKRNSASGSGVLFSAIPRTNVH